MSKARLVITAITVQGLSQAEAARTYNWSEATVSRLMARYRAEGEAAFTPRSRRPRTSPTATPPETIKLVLQLRENLITAGHDAGPETIGWHLRNHHGQTVSRATIYRILLRNQLVTPQPAKRPKSSFVRFEAAMPNQCWQSDFTHYQLTTGAGVEIITWLDDRSRMALHVSAHHRITTQIVVDTFTKTGNQHGYPASTLTDNGMVYTVRFAGLGRQGGRNQFETELRRLGITQKNGRGNHPQTQGKVERFQQTLKKWLHAQPQQPTTLPELQALLEAFTTYYNHQRPHRSLPHHTTPAVIYNTLPKASPTADRTSDTHDRVRHDIVDKSGRVTLRINSRLHHIGIGRTLARTRVILLIQDLNITIINTQTGEIIRELTLDPTRDYQPQKQQNVNPQTKVHVLHMS